MINPFISNNDSHYLFRKNYQFIPKPQAPSPPTTFSTSKLNFLQSRNPFNPPAATPTISSPVPSRSLSNSRVAIGSGSRDKLFLGKSRLLDEADGWKKELQSQERGKLQAYGAEGLRYNAYTTYTPNLYESRPAEPPRHLSRYDSMNAQEDPQFNDYYASYSKPIEVKAPKTPRDSFNPNIYIKADRSEHPPFQQSYSKKGREHFADQINEEEQSRNLGTGKKERSKYELDVDPIRQQSQRQSKLADMFGSQMDERFKQSMQHNSYASYYADDLVQSKQSKFAREGLYPRSNYLEESDVNRFQSAAMPNSLTVFGKIYYKLDI